MRALFTMLFVILSSSAAATGFAATGQPLQLAEVAPTCLQKCEKAKESCMAQHIRPDSTTATMSAWKAPGCAGVLSTSAGKTARRRINEA